MWDAREYLRLSDARGGNSIAEQNEENRSAAESRSWSMGPAYADPDRSASTFARRARDAYDLLSADLKSGKFGARHLIMWESSRGSRRVREWVDLIDLCEAAQVQIFVTSHGRAYDLSLWSDKKVLLSESIDSEGESHKISIRGRRTGASEAKKGRPYGRPPYGYKPIYNAKGKLDTWIADDTPAIEGDAKSRADVIRTLFKRLEDGHSLRRIAKDFEFAGFTNMSGTPFSAQHLRQSALKATYAAIRSYKGENYDGTWEALVSKERFYIVHRLLSDPSRRKVRSGRAVHEFTGALVCGGCGASQFRTDVRATRNNTIIYKCRFSCVSMLKDEVDGILTRLLIEYLTREDVYQRLTARTGSTDDVLQVRSDLAKYRADKDEMEREAPMNLPEARVLAKAIDRLEKAIAELEEKEREMTLPPALASLLGAREGIAKGWLLAPVEACREIVRFVMVPELMGRPTITTVSVGVNNVPAIDRIQWDVKSAEGRGK